MTEAATATEARTWDRDRLLGIGWIQSTIGLVTWLVGLFFPGTGALLTGQIFAAFGLGLIAASAARTLWHRNHERTDPFVQVGAFATGAVTVFLVLSTAADLIIA